ncbi:uncharacterized protein Z520_03557 [Fonsecaea multimorphosa CBS 102226]|uniref:Uncharacterized protein n=1 Tax=Fonsecaea multimorphosa CBS 102226 TaxID=1442371 RepID=A0A0D2HGA1_9EURO|nr:uncharacterized protein Z520_03557 [Fonsecaea multimorphosa CBS 102226]KIY00891.1 hypothetical protein Z520_03557 [Fonsecaea multimorphosa CBS 102226]OAL27717.1 hypothetical protein AYO22_03383 [Fonsecaea multimorphosa]
MSGVDFEKHFEKHVKEIAKQENVSWSKIHNAVFLVEALREFYSDHCLLAKETEIKKFMKFIKHGLNFSFRDHFDSGAGLSDSISSSSTEGTSSHSGRSEPEDVLVQVGQAFDDSDALQQPPGPFLSFRDAVATAPPRSPLETLKQSPWKACRVLSWKRNNLVPAVFAEDRSTSSWVSSKYLTNFVEDTPNIWGKSGLREDVGRLNLMSRGLVNIWIQPVDCCTGLWLTFNVTDDPKCCDLLIGREAGLQLQTARNAAASHYAAQDYLPVSGKCFSLSIFFRD